MEDEILRQMEEQGFHIEETDVDDEEIDIDLTLEAVNAINLFKALPDIFVGGMAGVMWIGKRYDSIDYIMDLLYIYKNRKRVFELLQICNEEYSKFINKDIGKNK